MGAYIRYKLRDTVDASPEKVNNWLDTQPEQEALEDIDHGQKVRFWDRRDREWWQNEHGGSYHLDVGEGSLKASCTPSEAKDLWAALFEKLHAKYDVAVLSSSCAVNLDHLSRSQLEKISDNGDALSGSKSAQARVRNLLTS